MVVPLRGALRPFSPHPSTLRPPPRLPSPPHRQPAPGGLEAGGFERGGRVEEAAPPPEERAGGEGGGETPAERGSDQGIFRSAQLLQ